MDLLTVEADALPDHPALDALDADLVGVVDLDVEGRPHDGLPRVQDLHRVPTCAHRFT